VPNAYTVIVLQSGKTLVTFECPNLGSVAESLRQVAENTADSPEQLDVTIINRHHAIECPRCGVPDEPHLCRLKRQQQLIDPNHPDQKRYDR
jgi:predicted RNA-binding Zn-ribbon protein involved in translation (DUF1610 family)